MAVATGTDKEEITPFLYKFYDKDYDYNDLAKAADAGLVEYINSLSRGSKDEQLFRAAYRDIMAGVKDNTIVFQDGRFHDTKGRYYNFRNNPKDKKDVSKDHYGLMANYIFGKMGGISEYVKPEDKSKIEFKGPESIGLAVTRNLFGTDSVSTQQLKDFIDIDGENKEAKNRARTDRLKRISSAYKHVADNFDNLFTNFTPAQRDDFVKRLQEASKYAGDTEINPGDYYSFGYVAPGLDYRRLLHDGLGYGLSEDSDPSEITQGSGGAVGGGAAGGEGGSTPDVRTLWYRFLDEKYPQYTKNDYRTINYGSVLQNYSESALAPLTTGLQTIDVSKLYDILHRMVRYPDNTYRARENADIKAMFGYIPQLSNAEIMNAILKELQRRGGDSLIAMGNENNLGQYHIPYTFDKGRQSGLVWDSNAKTVTEMSIHRIPYWQQRLMQEFQAWAAGQTSSTTGSHWADQYYSAYYKKGGVLKASLGTTLMDRSTDYLLAENNSENISNTAKWNGFYDIDRMDNEVFNGVVKPWETDGYTYDATGAQKKGLKALDLIKALNAVNKEYQNEKLSWDISKVKANAKGYEAFNKAFDTTGFNIFFNKDQSRYDYLGPTTYNRGVFYDRLKKRYTSPNSGLRVGDEVIYFDDVSKAWRSAPFAQSTGKGLKPEDKGYGPSIPSLSFNPPVDIQKMVKPAGEYQDIKFPGLQTDIDPSAESGKGGKNLPEQILNIARQVAPGIIRGSRLALSLGANNRIAQNETDAVREPLLDTQDRKSRVKGVEDIKQSHFEQAANLRSAAASPITSDASLEAARVQDAQLQADQLEEKGLLADNQEIRRTQDEALAREEDNMARRTDVANKNRLAIARAIERKARIESGRLKNNWAGWDEYLGGIEQDLLTENKERKSAWAQATEHSIQSAYQKAVRDYETYYESKHPGATAQQKLADSQYVETMQKLRERMEYEASQYLLKGTYAYTQPYSSVVPQSYEDILKVRFSKRGGVLNPSSEYLIKKVMKK